MIPCNPVFHHLSFPRNSLLPGRSQVPHSKRSVLRPQKILWKIFYGQLALYLLFMLGRNIEMGALLDIPWVLTWLKCRSKMIRPPSITTTTIHYPQPNNHLTRLAQTDECLCPPTISLSFGFSSPARTWIMPALPATPMVLHISTTELTKVKEKPQRIVVGEQPRWGNCRTGCQ